MQSAYVIGTRCREIGVLNDEEAIVALHMVDDRNLTVHTYNEPLAVEIYSRFPQYLMLMKKMAAGNERAERFVGLARLEVF